MALVDDLAHGGDGKVGLAGAGVAGEKQAGAGFVGEIVGVLLDGQNHAHQFAAGDWVFGAGRGEILERGVAIERRNLSLLFEAAGPALGAAIARLRAGDAGPFNDHEAQTSALRTNCRCAHRSIIGYASSHARSKL